MKKSVLGLAVILALYSFNASAGGNSNNNGPTFGGGGALTSTNTANANAGAVAGATANASVKNESTNLNVNSVGIETAIKNIVGQAQDQNQKQTQGQSTENANNSTQQTNVVVEGDKVKYESQVASALAPTTFATAMCQAARSGGFQNKFLGISLGGTITDDNCIQLEQLRVVSTIVNDQDVINEMACLASPIYRQARKNTNKPCNEDLKVVSTETSPSPVVSFNKIMGQP